MANKPTFLPIASAKACNNSLVFSGSWPATTLEGRVDKVFPKTRAENKCL